LQRTLGCLHPRTARADLSPSDSSWSPHGPESPNPTLVAVGTCLLLVSESVNFRPEDVVSKHRPPTTALDFGKRCEDEFATGRTKAEDAAHRPRAVPLQASTSRHIACWVLQVADKTAVRRPKNWSPTVVAYAGRATTKTANQESAHDKTRP